LRALESPASLSDAEIGRRLKAASDEDLVVFVVQETPADPRVRRAAAEEVLARRGGAHPEWMEGALHALSQGRDPAAEVARRALEKPATGAPK
jgi:hypothetical protein